MRFGFMLMAYSRFTSLPLIITGTFLSFPTFTSSVPQSVVIPGIFANSCIALVVPFRRESVMNTVSLDAFLLTISATATTSFKFSTFDCNTTTPISPLKPRGDIVSRFSKLIDWKDNLYISSLLSKENSPVSILRTPHRNRFVLSKAETVTKGTQEESDTDTIFPLTCAKQVKGNKNNINTTQMHFIS